MKTLALEFSITGSKDNKPNSYKHLDGRKVVGILFTETSVSSANQAFPSKALKGGYLNLQNTTGETICQETPLAVFNSKFSERVPLSVSNIAWDKATFSLPGYEAADNGKVVTLTIVVE